MDMAAGSRYGIKTVFKNVIFIQEFKCLQPLMICLSYSGTRNLTKRLSCEHDISVQFWSHELSSKGVPIHKITDIPIPDR